MFGEVAVWFNCARILVCGRRNSSVRTRDLRDDIASACTYLDPSNDPHSLINGKPRSEFPPSACPTFFPKRFPGGPTFGPTVGVQGPPNSPFPTKPPPVNAPSREPTRYNTIRQHYEKKKNPARIHCKIHLVANITPPRITNRQRPCLHLHLPLNPHLLHLHRRSIHHPRILRNPIHSSRIFHLLLHLGKLSLRKLPLQLLIILLR